MNEDAEIRDMLKGISERLVRMETRLVRSIVNGDKLDANGNPKTSSQESLKCPQEKSQ